MKIAFEASRKAISQKYPWKADRWVLMYRTASPWQVRASLLRLQKLEDGNRFMTPGIGYSTPIETNEIRATHRYPSTLALQGMLGMQQGRLILCASFSRLLGLQVGVVLAALPDIRAASLPQAPIVPHVDVNRCMVDCFPRAAEMQTVPLQV